MQIPFSSPPFTQGVQEHPSAPWRGGKGSWSKSSLDAADSVLELNPGGMWPGDDRRRVHLRLEAV